jgi:hypothetical protein
MRIMGPAALPIGLGCGDRFPAALFLRFRLFCRTGLDAFRVSLAPAPLFGYFDDMTVSPFWKQT